MMIAVKKTKKQKLIAFLFTAILLALTLFPASVGAAEATPVYKTLDELEGKNFAYVNGSVYTLNIEERLAGTAEQFYPSLAECITAVESGKADAAVQLSYCCQYAINQRPGTVMLLPETVADVNEAFFFPHGSDLTDAFNDIIRKFSEDGTLAELEEEWVAADESGKSLPEQDWDAPNGTLKFATSGVLAPFSYAGESGEPVGYDVELALLIARELGYHLEVSSIPMDSIFAAVDSGKADFGGTLTDTPERAAVCDFSEPVIPATISVIVRTEGAVSSGSFWERVADSFRKTFIVESRWKLILSGLWATVLISVCAGALGLLLGYCTVRARRSGVRWIGKLVDGYQTLMGGIPLVVVLMLLYYVVFGSTNISGTIVAILAFALSFGAVSGATMWTAVKSVDVVQEESGLALGYNSRQVFREIVFPLARRRFTPQLMGQFISLVKDTAIVGYIAVQDLTRAGDVIRARTMEAFFPLVSTAIIYLVTCLFLGWVLRKVTARLGVEDDQDPIKEVEKK